MVIGRVEVARPFAMSPFVREPLASNTNEREWTRRGATRPVRHTALALFVDGKKMQLKIFQVIWVTDVGSSSVFARFDPSIRASRKGPAAVALESASFAIYALRLEFACK